jgi:hypothetical protein
LKRAQVEAVGLDDARADEPVEERGYFWITTNNLFVKSAAM